MTSAAANIRSRTSGSDVDAAVRYRGETSGIAERLIVAPVTGTFHLTAMAFRGAYVEEGQSVGVVRTTQGVRPVRSAFAGRFMGVMAQDGERVRKGQPVAWIRS